ncbi:MAG: acyl carrier protein [Bdellovibrionales bacterium]|nr:acyl carrier protein [Bdellovibrionales bacterium]
MMKNEEILKQTIFDVFFVEVENIAEDFQKSEVSSWDSLGTVSLLNSLTKNFSIEIAPEEILAVKSFSDIVELLKTKGIRFE